jgi:peptide/nickel transport system substrate-binding protein
MTKSFRILAAAALVLAALGLAACGSSESGSSGSQAGVSSEGGAIPGTPIATTTPAPTGEVSEVTWDLPYGEPASIDPLKAYGLSENTILSNVCDSLLRIGPNLQIEPGLATSVTQPNNLTYVIKLRSGAKFWDGHPVTAEDVAYSLERQIDPKNASYYSYWVEFLKEAKVTGPNEVTLTLSKPNELIKGYLATGLGAVVEKSYTEAEGAKFGAPGGGMMCSGPFEFKSWQPGNEIVLTKNPHYWDPKLEPKVNTFVFKFITDPSALTNALQAGEIDGAYYVPTGAIQQLESSAVGTVYFGKSLIGSPIVPLHDSGPLYDPKIRKALSLSMDREGIAQAIYGGHAAPVNWAWGPDSFGYEREKWQEAYESQPLNTSPEPEAAEKLIAGDPEAKTPIVIAVQTGDQTSENVALAIQSAAKEVGLTVKIKILQPGQFLSISFDPKARTGIDAYIGSNAFCDLADPLDWLYFFAPKSSNPGINPEGYKNPQQNAMLDKALATTDPAKRMKYAIPAVKMFMEEQPVIPIVQFPLASFMNNEITGAPTSQSTFQYYPWAAAIGAK